MREQYQSQPTKTTRDQKGKNKKKKENSKFRQLAKLCRPPLSTFCLWWWCVEAAQQRSLLPSLVEGGGARRLLELASSSMPFCARHHF
jgi:hypothetical protein